MAGARGISCEAAGGRTEMTADPQIPMPGRPGPHQRAAWAGSSLSTGERKHVEVQPQMQATLRARGRLYAPRDSWERETDAIGPWGTRPGRIVHPEVECPLSLTRGTELWIDF